MKQVELLLACLLQENKNDSDEEIIKKSLNSENSSSTSNISADRKYSLCNIIAKK